MHWGSCADLHAVSTEGLLSALTCGPHCLCGYLVCAPAVGAPAGAPSCTAATFRALDGPICYLFGDYFGPGALQLAFIIGQGFCRYWRLGGLAAAGHARRLGSYLRLGTGWGGGFWGSLPRHTDMGLRSLSGPILGVLAAAGNDASTSCQEVFPHAACVLCRSRCCGVA